MSRKSERGEPNFSIKWGGKKCQDTQGVLRTAFILANDINGSWAFEKFDLSLFRV